MNFALAALLFIYVSWLICIFAINLIYYWLHKQDTGNDHMKELAHFIEIGANAFPRREFITILPFFLCPAIILYFEKPEGNGQIALRILVGGGFSLLAIYNGRNSSVHANVRTTQAARSSRW